MVSKLQKSIFLFKVHIALRLQCQWTYDVIFRKRSATKTPKIRIKHLATKAQRHQRLEYNSFNAMIIYH